MTEEKLKQYQNEIDKDDELPTKFTQEGPTSARDLLKRPGTAATQMSNSPFQTAASQNVLRLDGEGGFVLVDNKRRQQMEARGRAPMPPLDMNVVHKKKDKDDKKYNPQQPVP